MRQSGCTAVVTAAVMALGISVSAQKTTPVHPGKGGSPHVKTAWVIDGANITIEYGQPQLKGRADAAVMPAGQPWRTGADEATVLVTDKALKFGSYSLPAGTYTINTEPGDKGWQLIFGKLSKPGQWGVPYQKDLEDRPHADERRKDESAGRAAHDLDRRHAEGRNAPHRVGRGERDRTIHGGIAQSTVVSRQSAISVVGRSRPSEW